jgi:checkpoint serine/threonine-protein kinase
LFLVFLEFLFKCFRKVKKIRQSDGCDDNELKIVLEDSINRFGEDEQYKNDLRYLKLWCVYADISDNSHSIFTKMQQNGIGKDYALFYECWAMVLETMNDYSGAEEVFKQGLDRFYIIICLIIYLYLIFNIKRNSTHWTIEEIV